MSSLLHGLADRGLAASYPALSASPRLSRSLLLGLLVLAALPHRRRGAGVLGRRRAAGAQPQHDTPLHEHAARGRPARAGPALAPLPRTAGGVVGHPRVRAGAKPGSSSSTRAPPSGDSPATTLPPWASAIARTIARPSPVPPDARSRAASVRWKRSKTRSRWSAGMPGPSSSTTKRRRPPASALTRMRTRPALGGGVLDRVGQEVAQRLREAVGVGAQHALRDRPELEAPVGQQARPLPQLVDEQPPGRRLELAGTRACSVLASSSRSSTSRSIRATSACTQRSTRRTSSAVGSRCARAPRAGRGSRSAACAARARRRRRTRAGRANASVRRSSMWLKASASTRTSSRPARSWWMRGCRSPRVDARGDGGHPAQRPRERARRPDSDASSAPASASSAAEDERRARRRAGRRATLASGSPTPTVARRRRRRRAPALEQAQVADVGEPAASSSRRRARQQPRGQRGSPSPARPRVSPSSGARCRTARAGWCSAPCPGTSTNSSVELRAERLVRDVARGRRAQLRAACGRAGERALWASSAASPAISLSICRAAASPVPW